MKGIVWDGTSVAVRDLEVRDPGPGEVRVRIAAAGVCHSDLSVVNGTIPFDTPVVLGHEGAGIVEEVGEGVRKVKVGDHVVLSTLGNCGACGPCDTGHPTMCRDTFGKRPKPFTLDGEPAFAFANVSSFAEHTVVKANQAVVIDKAVPMESASLIGCGVITGVGAVLNRAKVADGQTAAVFGVGGVGLNVIQGLRLANASKIIAVDTVAAKEPLARQFGATDFIDASQGDAAEQIRSMLPAEKAPFGAGGLDWAFECVGHPAVLRSAVDILDWGGTCVVVGVPSRQAELSVPITPLVHVDRTIMGTRYGSARPQHDIPLLVHLYLEGKLMLDELVSQTYPLEDFDTVVSDMHDGKLARGVLVF